MIDGNKMFVLNRIRKKKNRTLRKYYRRTTKAHVGNDHLTTTEQRAARRAAGRQTEHRGGGGGGGGQNARNIIEERSDRRRPPPPPTPGSPLPVSASPEVIGFQLSLLLRSGTTGERTPPRIIFLAAYGAENNISSPRDAIVFRPFTGKPDLGGDNMPSDNTGRTPFPRSASSTILSWCARFLPCTRPFGRGHPASPKLYRCKPTYGVEYTKDRKLTRK